MRQRAKNRIRSRLGFTMAELLLTVMILAIATGLVAAGIPLAVRVYDKVVDSANAQVMLSTGMTVLRDELGMAYDVQTLSDTKVAYTSGRTGGECIIQLNDGEGGDRRVLISEQKGDGTSAGARELVYTANSRLRMTYDKVEYFADPTAITVDGEVRTCPAGTFLLTNVKVMRGDDVLAEKGTFVICTIRPSLG